MDWKLLVTVFSTIFIAEIGDKTQLATILYASGAEYGKLTVFLGSSLALVSTSALGVLVGASLAQSLNPKYLSWVAGAGFIGIGLWTIIKALGDINAHVFCSVARQVAYELRVDA